MPKKSFDQACAIARTLDIVGERWTLLIVRELLVGTLRFQDVQERLPGIPASLLSDRLKTLEENDIVRREYYSEHPPRAAYALTDAGRELGMVIGSLGRWGVRYLGAKMSKTAKHAQCGHSIEPSFYCSHCEEIVRIQGIVVGERTARAR
jgi:DNA-binding HxlR family transcriptional regulator